MKLVTHSGGFHADDVFAAAALLLLYPDADIVRTREEGSIAEGDVVFDVGGVYDEGKNLFDHHQPRGAGVRANGIPYAAFGLVWRKFGARVAGSALAAERIDEKLVQAIDAHDNGVSVWSAVHPHASPYLIQDVVFSFEPTWNEKSRSLDKGFMEVVAVAQQILAREVVHTRDALLGEQRVRDAYERAEDKRVIVLEEKYEWGRVLGETPEPIFVVSPERAPSTYWRVHAVRTDARSFTPRRSFPESWAGKRDAELVALSGVPDALFCHNKLFTVSARSRAGALALAEKAL